MTLPTITKMDPISFTTFILNLVKIIQVFWPKKPQKNYHASSGIVIHKIEITIHSQN